MASHPNEQSALRVLHVTQPTEGGTAEVVRQLILRDLTRGRSVRLACPESGLSSWATSQGVGWIDCPMSRAPSVGDLRSLIPLRRELAASDIALVHSSKAGVLGRVVARSLPTRRRPAVVFYPHGWSWNINGRQANVYKAIEKLLAPAADQIVAVSQREESIGRMVLGSKARGRLCVIQNGVDCARFSPDGERAPIENHPSVVCVGRLCEQKGQDLLVAALGESQLGDVSMYFVGEGPDRSQLRAQSDDAGVADRTHWIGNADPRPYYRAADLVVIPSRWEGFPLVTLESMACGANVLASSAAAADLLERDGILVMPNSESPSVIATTLAWALEEMAGSDEYRTRARATIVASFTAARVEDLYDALLDDVMDARVERSGRS